MANLLSTYLLSAYHSILLLTTTTILHGRHVTTDQEKEHPNGTGLPSSSPHVPGPRELPSLSPFLPSSTAHLPVFSTLVSLHATSSLIVPSMRKIVRIYPLRPMVRSHPLFQALIRINPLYTNKDYISWEYQLLITILGRSEITAANELFGARLRPTFTEMRHTRTEAQGI